jgi:hypothetical protein
VVQLNVYFHAIHAVLEKVPFGLAESQCPGSMEVDGKMFEIFQNKQDLLVNEKECPEMLTK